MDEMENKITCWANGVNVGAALDFLFSAICVMYSRRVDSFSKIVVVIRERLRGRGNGHDDVAI